MAMRKFLIILIGLIVFISYQIFDWYHMRALYTYYNSEHVSSFTSEHLYRLLDDDRAQCDWVYAKPRAYFKRQSSFYFRDVSLITLSYVTPKNFMNNRFDISVHVRYGNQYYYKKHIENVRTFLIKHDAFDATFVYVKLVAEFDIKSLDKNLAWNNFTAFITCTCFC